MSVADHLKIRLADFDRLIKTFIPGYDHMLNAAAAACGTAVEHVKAPVIVDLGVGTGALAARCLEASPNASIVGIDSDPEILRSAIKRFARAQSPVTLVCGDIHHTKLPKADAFVSTLTLHHIGVPASKRAFYKKCYAALNEGGVMVSGDFNPSPVSAIAERQMLGWISHLRQSYTPAETKRFLGAWAEEDTYMTLEEELGIMQAAGFRVDVAWRRTGFAVVVGVKA